jgi:hypothetical protein
VSWLNLVEGFFSNMARSMLRHIRVASKPELKAPAHRCHRAYEIAVRPKPDNTIADACQVIRAGQ